MDLKERTCTTCQSKFRTIQVSKFCSKKCTPRAGHFSKPQKPKVSKAQGKRLRKYSRCLNHNLSKAESWFWTKWVSGGFFEKSDHSNAPFGYYLPDVINRKYRYVIEVDEPYHETAAQKFKDEKKNAFYKSQRFSVLRIKAYDEVTFEQVRSAVMRIRERY